MKLANPLSWFIGERRPTAVEDLCQYMTSYTGRFFERFAAESDANRFEANDVIAVSCLAVEVPAAVSAWLLMGEGQDQTAQLLEKIGGSRECNIRSHDLVTDSSALALWELLGNQRNMGPTTVSKLMAAKRPHLFPIYDSYVATALLPSAGAHWKWWAPWTDLFKGPHAADLVNAVEDVRGEAAQRGVAVEHLSVLRVIDIVIWRDEERRRREHSG